MECRHVKLVTACFILFKIGCLVLTIYISVGIIETYRKNEDASVVMINKFDGIDSSTYPALTFCFYANVKESLYKGDYIYRKSQLNSSHYYKALLGMDAADELNSFNNISFEKSTLDVFDYLQKFKVEDTNDNTALNWKYSINSSHDKNIHDTRMIRNYQDPKRVCHTYHPSYTQNVKVDNVNLFFHLERLQTINQGILYFFVHYKNQFIRSMRYMHKQNYFQGITKNDANNFILFDLTHINIIKLREDAEEPCSNEIENDDKEWLHRAMKVIDCIPPYWRIFMRDQNQLSNCTSAQQLRSAARYLPYKNQLNDEIFSQYHPPCYRMRVTVNTNKDAYTDPTLLKIKFRYR